MIEAEVPPKDRRPSTSEAFTIVKSESYLRAYEASLPASYQDQFLNLGFFREGAMCSWTSSSNLGECPPLRLVRSLWRRFYNTCPIPKIRLFTLRRRSATGRRREMLRGDMQELIKEHSSAGIAVSEGGCSFDTAMPAVVPLKSNNVAVQLESSLTAPADFFVIGFERPLAENSRNSTIRQVESGGAFRFIKAYSSAPIVFGKTSDLSNFPPDMTYPFPTILLFRNVNLDFRKQSSTLRL
jgi:hypothetical protein